MMNVNQFIQDNKNKLIDVLCTTLCCLIMYADLQVGLGYSTATIYMFVILLAIITAEPKRLLFYAALATLLVTIGFYLSPNQGVYSVTYFNGMFNRIIAVTVIWIMTLGCIAYIIVRKENVEVEKNIHLIFNASPNALVMVNENGEIELVNDTLCSLFGYEKEELIGRNIDLLVPERFRLHHHQYRKDFYTSPVKKAMKEQTDIYGLKKNNEEVPVEVVLNPINNGNNRKIVAAITDITLRKKHLQEIQNYTKQLKKSNEELEQFAYVASHDLQEPLRMVSSYTQLLAKRYQNKLDDDANEFIHYAVDGAKRMQKLIQDLLKFSRLGNQSMEFTAVDTDQLTNDVIENMFMSVDESKTTITKNDLPVVSGNPTQLFQLFQNLLGNSIKYRHPDRINHVHISAQSLGNTWQFCIQDNGIGIEPQYFEKIFQIFQRLHNKDEYSGTGIGLALCKRIVHNHHGKIWVESEWEKGTRFYFTLPASQ